MRVVAFIDLDDTLFQTIPKCPPDEPRRPVAYRRDGAPLSFMTDRQARLFEVLDSLGTVIPVTARNLDAFRRVDLCFRSLAILDFGGVVLLPGGALDPSWDALVRPQTQKMASELEGLLGSLQAFIARRALGVSARLIGDFDMPLYVVMKHPRGDISALETIAAEALTGIDHERFFVHFNENNLSVVPRFLGKERAVQHVLEHHLDHDGPVLTLGLGDSLTDLGFLRQCDVLMVPRHAQLARALGPRTEEPSVGGGSETGPGL